MFGMLPSSAITCSLDTASVLPTISLILVGLYFSTCRESGDKIIEPLDHLHFKNLIWQRVPKEERTQILVPMLMAYLYP